YNGENKVDEVGQPRFMNARPLVDSVTRVETHAFRRDSLQTRVDRFDIDHGPASLLRLVEPRLHEDVGEKRIVNLQKDPGIGDRAIFLAHRRGKRGKGFL